MKPLLYIILVALASACTGAAGSDKAEKSGISTAAGSGSDMYYEYRLTTAGEVQMNGSIKMYLSSSGKARVENSMAKNVAGDKPVTFVILGSSDKPDQSIVLDDEAKTYSINHIDRDSLGVAEKMQSSATKIGEEKILGFHCVHARIVSTRGVGNIFKTTDTLDLWRSDDVPMSRQFKKLMKQFESKTGNYMYSPAITEQLEKMGCNGFVVKMIVGSKRTQITEELVKAEHKDLSAALFEIPSGYKEDKDGSF